MTPSDIANMSDDECLVAAMLLGLDWHPWFDRKDGLGGGVFNSIHSSLAHRRYAANKWDAARMFLRERLTPSNPRR